MATTPTVILGSGLAGYSLARELRKLAPDQELIILSADDGSYYSKPMLSNAFTSKKSPEAIPIASAEQMADQLGATIRPYTKVTAIDPVAHRVVCGDQSLEYAQIVLAIGADPIHIPLAGNAQDRVMSVNDLGDYARFRTAIAGAKHIVIMGAGLIGCEFANDLHNAGIGAEVVDPAPYPLNRFLPEPAGRALALALEKLGVRWRMGQVAQAVDAHGSSLRVSYSDGSASITDAVLSSVGLRPRTGLAATAGIATRRGIVTDRLLATSASNVYALGDCAEVDGLVLPFVMPIMHAARALAKTLSGQATRLSYPAMPVVVKTTAYPIVVSPPSADAIGAWEIQELDGGIRALFQSTDGALLGFALAGSATAEKNNLTKALPPVLA
jgi:rubredoxin-NAD+ reductase